MLEGDSSENKPAENSEHEPAMQGSSSSNKVLPTLVPPEPPQSPYNSTTASQEPHQRRENAKLVLEVAGVLILIVYTVFTALQWSQIRWTNRLTSQALQDSGIALDKTLIKMQGQTDATNKLYGEAQKQTSQSATLATNSGTQANEARIAAAAATSAAQTAKDTLHVSERAYVIVEEPKFDFPTKSMLIQLVNTGHIPSGKAITTVHEATYNTDNITGAFSFDNPAEKSWQSTRWDTVVPGSHSTLAIPVPLLEESRTNSGSQSIIVAGTIDYNDGFSGTKDQTWRFCFRNVYQVVMKKSFIIVCDTSTILPELEKADGYPNHENPN